MLGCHDFTQLGQISLSKQSMGSQLWTSYGVFVSL